MNIVTSKAKSHRDGVLVFADDPETFGLQVNMPIYVEDQVHGAGSLWRRQVA